MATVNPTYPKNAVRPVVVARRGALPAIHQDGGARQQLLRSAARFAVVGLLGTLVDMALFAALHLALGLVALPANALSYSAGIANNFLLHRRWTYSSAGQRPAARQFARFAAVSLSALALNTLVVVLLAPALGAALPDAPAALAAKVCATGLGMAWNFAANHVWTFRA